MARILMLRFAKAADAELLVKYLADHPDVEDMLGDDAANVLANGTVEAVVAQPTTWCSCDIDHVMARRSMRRASKRRAAGRESGWIRGNKYGWWLCARCGKPSRAMVEHFVTTMLAGCNDLLPEILGTGPPLSPHGRWLAQGGDEEEYRKGLPIGDHKRRHV
jgi:hypothetical protein